MLHWRIQGGQGTTPPTKNVWRVTTFSLFCNKPISRQLADSSGCDNTNRRSASGGALWPHDQGLCPGPRWGLWPQTPVQGSGGPVIGSRYALTVAFQSLTLDPPAKCYYIVKVVYFICYNTGRCLSSLVNTNFFLYRYILFIYLIPITRIHMP